MSTPPPPDRPTEPLRRVRPEPAPAPVVERVVAQEPVVTAVDPNVILLRLEDAVESLRTWLLVVGIVAVAALGVAIYAVVSDDTGDGRGGSASGLASDDRVTQLETRIDRISRQVQDLRTDSSSGGDTSALANRIDTLESTVKSLSGAAGAAGGTQDAIDELSKRIDDLATEVEGLKQAAP